MIQIFIGKYDYPHFNKNAPLGTSLFPLAAEREYAHKNFEYFKNKHSEDY